MSRVLVVDDDFLSRELLTAFLGSKQHNVTVAGTGQEALEKIRMDAPEVILLDIRLPDMNGVEVMKYIRTNFSESHIKVIATTGSTSDDEEKLIREAGFDDFITKPLDLNLVLSAVELGY